MGVPEVVDGVELGSCEFLPAAAKPRPSFAIHHRGRTEQVRRDCSHHITMSAVHRSIGSRLVRPALRPATARAVGPTSRFYATNEPKPHEHKTSPSDAPAVKLNTESTQIREESAAEGMRHQPDYNVAVDYRTSYAVKVPFTPVAHD